MFIWTISDVIGVALFVLFAVVAAAVYLRIWWQQWRCNHKSGVNETSACDAICKQCGKNLGFIGSWRAARTNGDTL